MVVELKLPVEPMEALTVASIPVGKEWQYEPKWDGFRCVAYRQGDHVELQSKSGQPLARYFPDVVAALKSLRAKQFVLDGEIVIPIDGHLSFDQLLLRVHPAESRVRKLSEEYPATLVVFDLLADARGKSLVSHPLAERRSRLEEFAKKYFAKHQDILLSTATRNVQTAQRWFKTGGTTLDGIIAKRVDLPYRAGERDGM